MKILTITNLYPPHSIGGYEERCYQVMQGLIEKGHDVHILSSEYSKKNTSSTNETSVKRLLTPHGFFGFPWLPIHKLYKQEVFNQDVLKTELKKINPDVVHVWNMGGISKSLLLTLQNSEYPIVYDVSDHWIARSLKADVWLSWWNDSGSPFRNILRSLLKIFGISKIISKKVPIESYKNILWDKIYFCSQFMRDLTADKGYNVSHADIIYCGVEAEHFKIKSEYSSAKKFIWVGRLNEDKDPLTAVRAMGQLMNIGIKDLVLHIYGRGDEEYVSRLKKEVENLQLHESVIFTSAPHSEMKNIYSKYDALLFTSNWGEPFALTPLEAMASGLPVIMCPDGGDLELAQHNVNCLQFEAGNSESLAEVIQQFLERDDFGGALAKFAHNDLKQKYDMPIIIDQIEAVLKQALLD